MSLKELGFHHFKQVIDESKIVLLRDKAEAKYHWLNNQHEEDQLPFIYALPEGGIYVKNAHSFNLEAILDKADAGLVLQSLLSMPCFEPFLGSSVLVNFSQCWIRRQFPLEQCPQGAHKWHQDGALAYDFLALNNQSREDLLDMLTIWIPFNNCGIEAPGLEIVKDLQSNMLFMDELKDQSIQSLFQADSFIQPACKPGDALLFGSNIVHRTHVRPQMKNYRTSLGIRIFTTIPERCKNDHFLTIPL